MITQEVKEFVQIDSDYQKYLDSNERPKIQSIYDISINGADRSLNFLSGYKGKVTLFTNTTVGCGNANQLEVLKWLHDDYESQGFSVIGIPTNDYCGIGITKTNHKPEKFAKGITCGMDSQVYSEEVYGTTFGYTEMTHSNPNDRVSATVGSKPGHNGNNEPYGDPHDFWKQVAAQSIKIYDYKNLSGIPTTYEIYYSWWLNNGFDSGYQMSGNYEKYLFDKDGYFLRNFNSQVLTYDHEKLVKEGAKKASATLAHAPGRSPKVFEEEYAVVKAAIESALNGELSLLNPRHPDYKKVISIND